MPKQVIILNRVSSSAADQTVKACCWFAIPAGQEIPIPGFESSYPRATAAEIQALQAGTVLEEVITQQYFGASIAQIQANLQAKYAARQAQLTGQLNPNVWNGSSWDGASWSMLALAAPVSMQPVRRALGAYRCASPLITGAASAQNLVSIENPAASTVNVVVKRVELGGVVVAISTALFAYRIGRTTGLPSAGTILTAQKYSTLSSPAPVAIVRQAPTATAAAGDMWTGTPGALVTAAAGFNSVQLLAFAENREDDDVLLAPGEGLLVRADLNTTGWRHMVSISWQEASGN